MSLFDEVKQALALDIWDSQVQMGLRDEAEDQTPAARALLRSMVTEHNRKGRISGGGFFDYTDTGKSLSPGLSAWRDTQVSIPEQDLKDRIFFRAVIESLKCLEEGVVHSVEDANVGAVLGIGAPMHTGGYLQFINTYGNDRFDARCEELACKYGRRFKPPELRP